MPLPKNPAIESNSGFGFPIKLTLCPYETLAEMACGPADCCICEDEIVDDYQLLHNDFVCRSCAEDRAKELRDKALAVTANQHNCLDRVSSEPGLEG